MLASTHGPSGVHHDLSSMHNPAHSLPATQSVPSFLADANTQFPRAAELWAAAEPEAEHSPSPAPAAADSAAADSAAAEDDEARPWWRTMAGIIGIFIVINLIALGFGSLFF
ncbi:hypothetical protein [Corynebacterium sp. TAE3-ERU30]|uniref:hypothetical protein n=1 Tax=Corynebacterium sp. TAE3-ERU30 TaxID=2849496 RepID=UPI001C44ADFC|nr:hypothetical protein [Corynebacterium sp. TAE3-ERU30]MBV7281846.1 hypothetical protein [Corynebacterium sp. TAE3-ERU30]